MIGWKKKQAADQIFDESGLNQQQWNNGVESISELRLLNPKQKGNSIYLASINEGQDEGSGRFVATQKSGLVDDGGTIISSANPLLFWVRQDIEYVTPEMFGYPVVIDALQKSINHGAEVVLSQKEYNSSAPVQFRNGLKITGTHPDYSRIVKKTASTVNITGVGDLDCAAYMAGTESASNQIFIENVGITKEPIVGADVGVGTYFRYTARSSFKNFWVLGGETAIKTYDTWMCNWTRCEAKASVPWDLNVGTSNTFEDCWAITGKQFAWKAFNLMYSAMINCGADYTGVDGTPADSVYHFTGGSTVTMVGCASEHSHAYNLIYINNSQISVVNGKHMQFHNKYQHSDVGRRGIICSYDYDAILNVSGGDYSAEYNDTTGGAYVPWGCVYRGALNSKDVRYSKAIFDIKDSAWGITALDYAWVNYEYNGLVNIIDNRAADTSYSNHSYTEKSFGFKSRTLRVGDSLGDLRNGLDKFVYAPNSPDAPVYPSAPPKCHVITMSDFKGSGDASMFVQMAFSLGTSHVSYRWGDAGYPVDQWIEFLTKANTTTDSNGFVKSASPIVRLFSDHIEKNSEVSDSVSFKKIGVGDYLLKGASGFSNDGWYIETPKDANGNVLFAVIYTTLENNDISIKTYKKKFDVETASIVADLDSSVDITEGRWIDIRLN